MSLFQNILSDLQSKFLKEGNRCEEIAKILSSALHTTINPEQIVYKKGSVVVHVSPTIKMAIKIKEKELIKLLNDNQIPVTTIR